MKVLGRMGIAAAISVALTALASPALACSIMPPPPAPAAPAGATADDIAALNDAWGKAHALVRAEEDRAWRLQGQARLFDDAKSLVLVRYDRAARSGDDTLAILKPIRWLKGRGVAAELQLGMTEAPPCGQMIGHDAYYGKPGEVFLVYLSGNTLRAPDVLQAMSLDRIIEPRTIAMLTAAPQ